ncbi:MAG TPA: hypothetical protein VF778_13785 [Xanthobacteraceae bacterium]
MRVRSAAEAALRHPAERPLYIGSVILNFVLMALAIAFVIHPPEWIKEFPFIGKADRAAAARLTTSARASARGL